MVFFALAATTEPGHGMHTTIYLIRHGQIDANVDRHWHGSTDSDLNDTGRHQAERMAAHVAAAHPDIEAIYASPLRRTRLTAEPLARRLCLDVVPEHGVREYGIGELEGTPFAELAGEHRFFEKLAADHRYAPRGGESPQSVCDRFLGALDAIRDRHTGGTVAVVSHGAAMGIALSYLLHERVFPFHDYHMENTGVTRLLLSEQPVVDFFNRADHLTD